MVVKGRGGRPRNIKRTNVFDFKTRGKAPRRGSIINKRKKADANKRVKTHFAKHSVDEGNLLLDSHFRQFSVDAEDIMELGHKLGLEPMFSDNDTL